MPPSTLRRAPSVPRRAPRRRAGTLTHLDPSRTLTLRRQWEADLARRFTQLRREILALVVEEDALGLQQLVTHADEPGRWITVKGNHIFIPEGKDAGDAIKEHFEGLKKIDPPKKRPSAKKLLKAVIAFKREQGAPILTDETVRRMRPFRLKKATTLYRGMSFSPVLDGEMYDKLKSAKPGDVIDIDQPGSTSWSAGRGTAEMFMIGSGTMPMLVDEGLKSYSSDDPHRIRLVLERVWSPEETVFDTDRWANALEREGGDLGSLPMFGTEGEVITHKGSYKVRVVTKLVGKNLERADDFTLNTRWQFHSAEGKVRAFLGWLKVRLAAITGGEHHEDSWWHKYIIEGFKKGAARAFDDSRPKVKQWQESPEAQERLEWYNRGTREEFLRSAFYRPVSKEKVQLLASRTFTDLKGTTEAMASRIAHTLVDGLTRGANPREIGRDLAKEVDVGKVRAQTIARTEIIRTHAEGQLDAFEQLGLTEVGVMAEWSTAGANDKRVCKLCRPLDGVVMTVQEARGLLPRHSNCRCAWLPAQVGEKSDKQKKSKGQVQRAIDASYRAELPKRQRRTLQEQKTMSKWGAADKDISPVRPKSILSNIAVRDPS